VSKNNIKKCWDIYDKHYRNVATTDTVYKTMIKKYVSSNSDVLDAGCGQHLDYVRLIEPLARFTLGCDLVETFDSSLKMSDSAVVRSNLDHIPVDDATFTMIICRSVFEHIEQPLRVLQEFNRILKLNGRLIFMTPNLYDYVSIISRLSRHRFHQNLLH